MSFNGILADGDGLKICWILRRDVANGDLLAGASGEAIPTFLDLSIGRGYQDRNKDGKDVEQHLERLFG